MGDSLPEVDLYDRIVMSGQQRLEAWDRACANYGDATLAYALDLPRGDLPEERDSRRWEVVEELSTLMVSDSPLTPEQKLSLRTGLLLRFLPGIEKTYIEHIREHVGGRLPNMTGDPLVDALVRLLFNGLAIDQVPGSETDRFLVSASFQDPRLLLPAANAFLADPDLSRLFPDADRQVDDQQGTTATSMLTWLPAGGGTTYLSILLGSLVEQTLARMRLLDSLSEENIEDFVQETIDLLRRFARGVEVDTYIVTGLLGVDVSGSIDRGAWGIRTAAGLAINGMLGREESRPRSVLWARTPHRLLSVDRADLDEAEMSSVFESMNELNQNFHGELTRKISTLRFAILAWALEAGRIDAVSVHTTASWSLLPIAHSQPPWVHAESRPVAPIVLSVSELERVAEIVEELGEVTPRLDIALSRIIRVASERRDPADALVDAVIAWENMLGSTTETTFKVCASLSWLLEPRDEERRRQIHSRAKKIYGLRSRLVHGAEHPDFQDSYKSAQDALALAIRAFLAIHSNPEFVDMKSGSRSEAILMRGPA